MDNDSKPVLSYSERGKLGAAKSLTTIKKLAEERHAIYDANPKLCKQCGKPLTFKQATDKQEFCSRSCSCTYNNIHKQLIIKTCKSCGKEFKAKSGNTQYCNNCCVIVPKDETKTNKRVKKLKDIYVCLNCGKEYYPSHSASKFCSSDCFNEYSNKERLNVIIEHIESTGEVPYTKDGVLKGEAQRRAIRRYLEHKHGHKCSICGNTEWNNQPIPLIVDHIDGDHSNHKIENYRLVCPNCDAQLPTYKSKNKNGRNYRNKYYLGENLE